MIRWTDAAVPIASSTSTIPLSLLVSDCTHRERVAIGHPAQPQLSTFVEVTFRVAGRSHRFDPRALPGILAV